MNRLTLTLIAAAALIAGCRHNDTEQSRLVPFVPDGEIRRSQEAANMQAGVGAREDGILYAWHFDGADLSPLGQEKLDLIVDADTLDTLPIYLDVRSNTFAARKDSVVAYLKDKGLVESHVKVMEGVNPDSRTPAQVGLSTIAKTDTADSTGSSSTTPSSGQATASNK